ncbi:MAG: hypothetical protein B9S33_19170 [Pedosphaera sp. Tous-C6FEB]|nr:MAG: hypothetical protein B9S33_19170 [Pedosphaera sp. Tous-C6FEB]
MIEDNPKLYWLVMLIFPLAGAGFLIVSAVSCWRMKEWVDAAKPVRAKVVGIVDRQTFKNRYWPEVAFRDATGKELKLACELTRSSQLPEVGAEIEVLYRPEFSDTARLDTFATLWGPRLAFGAFGLVFSAIGCVGVRQAWKQYPWRS